MKSQSIKKLLTLDYAMIDEALRRLQDGTCCLLDEDKTSALDLFQRIRRAFEDHVSFEEPILPLVVESIHEQKVGELCLKMRKEHVRLRGLLEAAGHELAEAHPVPFRAVISAFKDALQDHLELEMLIPYEKWIATLDEAALLRLKRRADVGFLGAE